ncbi:hypothetical protein R1flu_012468 [Riccia fluitans]|uniref:Uncharacterized protein n=1 Tax=Riccia fluitans TaxID=41844 RepID=A0ABD1ZB11_9MARC
MISEAEDEVQAEPNKTGGETLKPAATKDNATGHRIAPPMEGNYREGTLAGTMSRTDYIAHRDRVEMDHERA